MFGPFLYGGYDISNKLPNTQNWTLDFQYQFSNNWLFDLAYVGNRGVHEVLPVPFNQSLLATPSNPVNGQMYSYGGLSPLSSCNAYYTSATPLDLEPLCPPPYYAGNAEVRVPYIGYDMNSVFYEAEGISNYNALQLQVRKRLSNGLQFTASYTWSHALDEQSGLGLFVTGNNPLVPRDQLCLGGLRPDARVPGQLQLHTPQPSPKQQGSRVRRERLDHWRADRGAERPAL